MICLLLCLAVALSSDETSTDLPDGAAVVEAFVKAKGGTRQLRQTTSYRLQLEVRVDGRVSAQTEILQTSGRHRTTHTLPDGSRLTHGTDGKVGWYSGPDGKVWFLQGEELAEYLRHNTTLHESLEWKDHYPEIRCTGRVKVDGKPAWEVQFTPASGRPVKRCFDVQSGLYVREIITEPGGGQAVHTISDYRRVAGVLVPHKRVTRIGNHTTEYIVQQAESNVRLADDAFAIPQSPPSDDSPAAEDSPSTKASADDEDAPSAPNADDSITTDDSIPPDDSPPSSPPE